MKARAASLTTIAVLGAVIGYGGLAVFLALVSVQVYRWFRDGEWIHVALGDLLSTTLSRCCVRDSGGAFAHYVAWFDSPDTWLGLHRALELIPGSFALFALSILGNSLFIFCRDRLRPQDARAVPARDA